MDYLELTARVTSNIPDKSQVIVRYHGLYSNAYSGKMRKVNADPSRLLVTAEETPFIPCKAT